MRVALTGGTGFLGRPLVAHLQALGHECTVLSRHPERARACFSAAVTVTGADRLPPCEAVIHLAGESVAALWTPWKRRAILRSRVEGTQRIVEAMRRLPVMPRVFLCASAVGIYGHRPGEILSETAAPDPRDRFRAQVCRAWEAAAQKAAAPGTRVTMLRIGNVMDPLGGYLGGLLPIYRHAGCFVLGEPAAAISWISLEDAIRLIAFALECDAIEGPLNLVAPAPVTQRAFAHTLAQRLGVPVRGGVPGELLAPILGEFSAALLDHQHVAPERACAAGFRFTHPAWRSCLDAMFTAPGGVLPR